MHGTIQFNVAGTSQIEYVPDGALEQSLYQQKCTIKKLQRSKRTCLSIYTYSLEMERNISETVSVCSASVGGGIVPYLCGGGGGGGVNHVFCGQASNIFSLLPSN